jgi:lysozyme family protein
MAKGTFEAALRLVLKHEGGYVDHPSDPGGATNLGITIGTLSGWLGRNATKAEVKALTVDAVKPIYRKNYWDRVKGDDLPAGLDYAVFDYAVNSGPSRAVMHLQQVLGVAQDGKIGPITLAAIGKRNPADMINALCDRRMQFLRGLSTFSTFGRGWTSRVDGVRSNALGMAKAGAVARPIDAAEPADTPPDKAPIWPIVLVIALALAGAFLFLPIFPKG